MPGGNYDPSTATNYVATGHLPIVLVATQLAVLAVVGLICVFAYLRETIATTAGSPFAARVLWGCGITGAALYGAGWGIFVAQPIAHAEGSAISITPSVTYLISEVGVETVFGPATMFTGLALIVLMLASRGLLPGWLRWTSLVVGILVQAGVAYFPFFLLLLWGIVFGSWLLATGRASAAR